MDYKDAFTDELAKLALVGGLPSLERMRPDTAPGRFNFERGKVLRALLKARAVSPEHGRVELARQKSKGPVFSELHQAEPPTRVMPMWQQLEKEIQRRPDYQAWGREQRKAQKAKS
jgi:hypothetical protein